MLPSVKRILVWLLVLLPALDTAMAGSVRWHDPDADFRAVFTRPDGYEPSVMVSLPYSGSEAAARAFLEGGREIPISIIHRSTGSLHVLVRTGAQRPGASGIFYVYYGRKVSPVPEELVNRDLEPVSVSIYSSRVNSIPANWERMLYLIGTQNTPAEQRVQKDFAMPIRRDRPEAGHARGDGQRQAGTVVRMSTHIVVPDEGVYRVHLDCNDSAFVVIDGKLEAQWPGRHAAGRWKQGNLVFLGAGPHMLELYGASMDVTEAKIALSDPKQPDVRKPVEEFMLASAAAPLALRVEERGKTLHAGFSYSIGKPYKFRGMQQVFVPVTLRDFSRNDLSWGYTSKWRVSADGTIPSGSGSAAPSLLISGTKALGDRSAVKVFDSLGIHRAAIEIRDKLGFVSTFERTVDTRNLQFQEYAVSAEPVNVFPCLFRDDIAEPAIRVAMQGSSSLEFLLEWKQIDADGSERRGSSVVNVSASPVKVNMFSARAGEVERIDWELSHRGYRIDGGTMKFEKFPFASLPYRADEDRVYDSAGHQVFYVSSRTANGFSQPGIRSVHLKAGITCLDDMLSLPRPLAGDQPDFAGDVARLLSIRPEKANLTGLSSCSGPGSLGIAGLICKVAEASSGGGGIAVVSVGRNHFLKYNRPHEYERLLACITDLILSRRSMRVVLVTMPPGGNDSEAVREYAAAVRRVADARRVPVVDLYSGFMGMGAELRPFRPGGSELSDSGLRFASQVTARVIVQGYRMPEDD